MCYACDGAIPSGIPKTWREFLLMPPEPQSLDEYHSWFHANQRITGYGVQTTMHMPCPFCAAPEWASWGILEAEEAMRQDRTCQACGRSGKIIFTINTPEQKQFELVQTGGSSPPEWLKPAPRRVGA